MRGAGSLGYVREGNAAGRRQVGRWAGHGGCEDGETETVPSFTSRLLTLEGITQPAPRVTGEYEASSSATNEILARFGL